MSFLSLHVVLLLSRRRRRQCQVLVVGFLLLLVATTLSWSRKEVLSLLFLPIPIATTTELSVAAVTTTVETFTNNGCGLDATRHNVHWNPVGSTATSPRSSYGNNNNNSSSLHYMKQVYECAKRFKWSYAADNDNDNNQTNKNSYWQELVCHQQQQSITHETVLSVIKQHDRILLAGDSVMRQQYFVLLCMVEPNLQIQNMSLYNPRDRKKARYEFQHSKGGGGGRRNISTTTLFYVPYGYMWNAAERNLYYEAVPYAILMYTNHSAIVLDSSRHYDSTRGHLLQKAVTFMAQQATQTNATVYYMEPTPEEWPTSNGIFTPSCHGVCACQMLTQDQLQGRGLTQQDISSNTSTTSNSLVDIQQDIGNLPMPSAEVFGKLYPRLYNKNNTNMTNQSSHLLLCIPDCLPATWRMDLVRYTLQQHDENYSKTPTQQNSNDTKNINKNKVQLVPTFWQLVARNQHSSRKSVGDCTHRSFDALVMMNQQLIRSMMMKLDETG